MAHAFEGPLSPDRVNLRANSGAFPQAGSCAVSCWRGLTYGAGNPLTQWWPRLGSYPSWLISDEGREWCERVPKAGIGQ